ncbi:MAG: hypothetical protein DDT19_01141 [Syntrophomonadaceae bacterium]|nr:hypothetical protein [Bacillota bacterium]
MKEISGLLKGYTLPVVKGKSERGELVKFFADAVERPPRVVAIRLSHYSVSELYAVKSGFSDRLTRNGIVAARKYFWAISRTI